MAGPERERSPIVNAHHSRTLTPCLRMSSHETSLQPNNYRRSIVMLHTSFSHSPRNQLSGMMRFGDLLLSQYRSAETLAKGAFRTPLMYGMRRH